MPQELKSQMPVVLIHGALRSALGMLPTLAYLQTQGFQARAFGYRTRTASLTDHATRLEALIQDWLGDEAPVAQLGLLTPSFGGLIARTSLHRAGAGQHSAPQPLVMLAPPLQGAQPARPPAALTLHK